MRPRVAGRFCPIPRLITRRQMSLRINFVSLLASQAFDLALSFPILKDLAVSAQFGALSDKWDSSDDLLTIINLPSPLAFTGSLDVGGIGPFVNQTFSLSGSIYLRKLTLRSFRIVSREIIC